MRRLRGASPPFGAAGVAERRRTPPRKAARGRRVAGGGVLAGIRTTSLGASRPVDGRSRQSLPRAVQGGEAGCAASCRLRRSWRGVRPWRVTGEGPAGPGGRAKRRAERPGASPDRSPVAPRGRRRPSRGRRRRPGGSRCRSRRTEPHIPLRPPFIACAPLRVQRRPCRVRPRTRAPARPPRGRPPSARRAPPTLAEGDGGARGRLGAPHYAAARFSAKRRSSGAVRLRDHR